MVLVIPVGLTAASPAPAATASQTVWAYGAVRTLDFSGVAHNGWEYSGSATYGFSVVLNQTNTSATTFELTVNRTMGALFQVQYCYPSCHSPRYFGNLSDHVYETVSATANFTTQGAVDELGAEVGAIALNNSQSHLLANVTESASSYVPNAGVTAPRSLLLDAQVVASSAVLFTPGLGVLPTNLTTAQSWNSTSNFTAHAGASYQSLKELKGPLGSVHQTSNGSIQIPASGTVTLSGSFSPNDTVDLGGASYPEIALQVHGPFAVREGFILVPSAIDLFNGGSAPGPAGQNGSASAAMSWLDARASASGHVGIAASEWVYDSTTRGPSSGLPGVSGPAELSASATNGSDAAPTTTVQGEPESVGTAQSQQTCLLTDVGCPSGTAPTGFSLRGIAGLLGVAVVVIVVVAAVALVAERCRMPPPAYPNAALYPPGAARPVGRVVTSKPPPPVEDDPLRHLW
jgi:hypothetical protein